MTLSNGVKITAREMAAVVFIVALIGFGVRLGAMQEKVLSGMDAIKKDVCQYAVPPEARRFAYTCRENNNGSLAAQEPR